MNDIDLPSATVGLVNLGDSYSAAIGTGGVRPSPSMSGCFQGVGPDHVAQLVNQHRVTLLANAACAGMDSAGLRRVVEQPRIRAALGSAGLVTMTIGGNDIAWVETILQCSTFSTDSACDAALGSAAVAIRAGAVSSGTAVARINELTDARVLVMGYPHLLDPAAIGLPVTPQRIRDLNAMTDEFISALRESVVDNGATFIDVTHRFDGHGAGALDPWINLDLRNPTSADNLHPNTRGYVSGYYAALAETLNLAA